MREIVLNGRWPLVLPEHRAAQWATGWERKRLDSIHDHLAPGHVIYDIGAEEGDMSALYSSWGAEVVLAEPNPKVWANIRAIWEANGLVPPLRYIVGFVGDEPRGDAVERAWPECSVGPLIGDHVFSQLNERPDIPATTVDALAASVPPDLITMDVEGSELRVLRGARQTLRDLRPLVWVSIHPTFMTEQYGDHPVEIHTYMADLGYIGTLLVTDHEEHWYFQPRERAG